MKKISVVSVVFVLLNSMCENSVIDRLVWIV